MIIQWSWNLSSNQIRVISYTKENNLLSIHRKSKKVRLEAGISRFLVDGTMSHSLRLKPKRAKIIDFRVSVSFCERSDNPAEGFAGSQKGGPLGGTMQCPVAR